MKELACDTCPFAEAEGSLACYPTSEQLVGLSVAVRAEASFCAFDRLNVDTLTGLRSYGSFQTQLYHAVERQVAHDEYSGGFIFIDCSNTHELNNEYGHHTVDEGFREIGEVLRGSLREGDLCCRRSGDEFIVYLPGDKEVVTIVSDRLREILEEGVPLLKGVRLSARLYVVHAEQIGSYEEAMRLIEGADLKLGERKRKRGQDVPD